MAEQWVDALFFFVAFILVCGFVGAAIGLVLGMALMALWP